MVFARDGEVPVGGPVKTWWRRNRPAAPDLFEQELAAALDRIAQAPALGRLYEAGDLDVPVRRVLLPKTLNHVYCAEDGQDVAVLSVWGALHEGGPKLARTAFSATPRALSASWA